MKKFDSEGYQIGNAVTVGSMPLGFGDMTGYEYGRTMTESDEHDVPSRISSIKAYPNPFNSVTLKNYYQMRLGMTSIDIYNSLGQKVETLFAGIQEAGNHTVTWQAADLPSGLYFVRKTETDHTEILRIL